MPYHAPIPGRKEEPLNSGIKLFAEAEKLMHIAFVLPSSVFIGWLFGYWVGLKTHMGWMQIAGILLGSVSGLFYVIRMAFEAEKKAAKADRENGASATSTDETDLFKR